MAHALSYNEKGEAEMFYAGETPWHGLGTSVEKATNVREAFELAKLDWLVKKEAVQTLAGEVIPSWYRTYREDNNFTLGMVGNRYTPFQNLEMFDFMDSLLETGEMKLETAGAIHGGKKIWALGINPNAEDMRVQQNDSIDPYILFMNSHDGSGAMIAQPTPIRVVCQNTLNYALQRGSNSRVKFNHVGELGKRVELAREVLVNAHEDMLSKVDVMKKMVEIKHGEYDREEYFSDTIGLNMDNTRSRNIWDRLEILKNATGTNNIGSMNGSLWQDYNVITEWVDHSRIYDMKGNIKKGALTNTMFGSGSQIKRKAYSKAQDIVMQTI